jgi:hypothetical protein
MGYGGDLRNAMGIDGGVNPCSGAYGHGTATGVGVVAATGAAGAVRGLAWRAAARESKAIGNAFQRGKKLGSIQEGVNPKTLTPAKDLEKLNPSRLRDAAQYARDKAIEVTSNGTIRDGHHRVKNAIDAGRAVDTVVAP